MLYHFEYYLHLDWKAEEKNLKIENHRNLIAFEIWESDDCDVWNMKMRFKYRIKDDNNKIE